VLEGSVRKAHKQLRINTQLIDVATGAHLWADRFDGALGDIFDLQDKIAQQVAGAITPEVDRAEIERACRRTIGKIDAVTAYYRGSQHIHFPTTSANNETAARYFEQAIALDPDFARHMAALQSASHGDAPTIGLETKPKTTPRYCVLPSA
jgi:hypothetical protein